MILFKCEVKIVSGEWLTGWYQQKLQIFLLLTYPMIWRLEIKTYETCPNMSSYATANIPSGVTLWTEINLGSTHEYLSFWHGLSYNAYKSSCPVCMGCEGVMCKSSLMSDDGVCSCRTFVLWLQAEDHCNTKCSTNIAPSYHQVYL